jgi:hypothetical protein
MICRTKRIVKPRMVGYPWWFFMARNLANALAKIEAAKAGARTAA